MYIKDQLLEIVNNSKVGLIGSSVMIAIGTSVDFVGERPIRIAMLFIGLLVGILTLIKLSFEVYASVIKFIGRRRMLNSQDLQANKTGAQRAKYQRKK